MNAGYGQRRDWRTLVGVAGLHVLVVFALLHVKPVAEAVGLQQPLMVSLLAASEPEPPREEPKPLPPTPQTQPRRTLPPPVLAARTEAPTPAAVPLPPTEPVPVPVVLSAPEPEPVKPVAAAIASYTPPAPITPPRFDADYLDNPAPAYPGLSRRLGEHGRVLLRVLVSPEGLATQVEVRESSGYERLDKAARDTVRNWRFVPARQGTQGIAAWVQVPISFLLRS